jgi:hypothetical protein
VRAEDTPRICTLIKKYSEDFSLDSSCEEIEAGKFSLEKRNEKLKRIFDEAISSDSVMQSTKGHGTPRS